MKLFLIGITILLSAISSIGYAQKKKISAFVYYYQPYCGGARPTPEMEKEAQTPKPYAGKKIFFISETGKVDSVKTNEYGKYKVKLKAGTYKFYEEWRYHKQTPDRSVLSHFDKDCLKNEWAMEFQLVTVSKSEIKKEDKNSISNYCDYNIPCLLEEFKPVLRQ